MTQAIDCPSCKQQITIDDSPQQIELNQLLNEVKELKNVPKMQSFIPSFQCTEGNCREIHKNPRYSRRPKGKCRNCDQFSLEKEGTCPWCKETDSIEEIDKDELTDLGIRLPD